MLIYLLILLAVASRFVPHVENLAAVTAVAIFAGSQLPKKHALLAVVLARLASDLFLGFFEWQTMVAVYASHIAGVFLGAWVASSATAATRWLKIVGSGFASAVLFFLVTNFALLYSFYPHTWQGIVQSYTNALPFFRGTLVGDVGYTVAIFALYEVGMHFGSKLAAKRSAAA